MFELRYRISKLRQRAMMKVAWALPDWLAYWTTVRVVAHATTGAYSSQIVPELAAMDAIERWGKDKNVER